MSSKPQTRFAGAFHVPVAAHSEISFAFEPASLSRRAASMPLSDGMQISATEVGIELVRGANRLAPVFHRSQHIELIFEELLQIRQKHPLIVGQQYAKSRHRVVMSLEQVINPATSPASSRITPMRSETSSGLPSLCLRRCATSLRSLPHAAASRGFRVPRGIAFAP